jgi:hypothetical protein
MFSAILFPSEGLVKDVEEPTDTTFLSLATEAMALFADSHREDKLRRSKRGWARQICKTEVSRPARAFA